MGLLKFLFIAFVVITLINVFFRYVMPFLLKRFVNKKMKDFGYTNEQRYNEQNQKREGEVTVEYDRRKKHPTYIDDDEGEYIDYKDADKDQ